MKAEDVMESVERTVAKMLADDDIMRRHARAIRRAVDAAIEAHCRQLAASTGRRVAVKEQALGVIGIDHDPTKPHCLSLRNDIAVLAPGQEPPPGWTIYEAVR